MPAVRTVAPGLGLVEQADLGMCLEMTSEGVNVDRLLFFLAPSPRAHLEMLAGLGAALTRGGMATRLQPGMTDAAIADVLAESVRAAAAAKEAKT